MSYDFKVYGLGELLYMPEVDFTYERRIGMVVGATYRKRKRTAIGYHEEKISRTLGADPKVCNEMHSLLGYIMLLTGNEAETFEYLSLADAEHFND